MAKFPRRNFLKTIGGAAVATALPNIILGAQSPSPSIGLFWEEGFPSVQGFELTLETLRQSLKNFAVTVLNERDLIAQLNATRFDLLITPHGSAFPKRAWPAFRSIVGWETLRVEVGCSQTSTATLTRRGTPATRRSSSGWRKSS